MPELHISYLQNGEWIEAYPTSGYIGAGIIITPEDNDTTASTSETKKGVSPASVIDLTNEPGWSTTVSAQGGIEIFTPLPRDQRLGGWILTLYGLSRMYRHLKMNTLADLFGPELPPHLELIYTETAPYRESADDYLIPEAAKESRTLAELQAEAKESINTITIESAALTPRILANRQRLFQMASYTDGDLLVDRSVFFKE